MKKFHNCHFCGIIISLFLATKLTKSQITDICTKLPFPLIECPSVIKMIENNRPLPFWDFPLLYSAHPADQRQGVPI